MKKHGRHAKKRKRTVREMRDVAGWVRAQIRSAAKVTRDDEIRRLYREDWLAVDIATALDLSDSHVRNVLSKS